MEQVSKAAHRRRPSTAALAHSSPISLHPRSPSPSFSPIPDTISSFYTSSFTPLALPRPSPPAGDAVLFQWMAFWEADAILFPFVCGVSETNMAVIGSGWGEAAAVMAGAAVLQRGRGAQ